MNSMPSRTYPWGNDWRHEFANVETRGTTLVDAHPDGVSPYGCMDMAGNVWEWTASDYDTLNKVVRGGSWFSHRSNARCASRSWNHPDYRGVDSGFRVVLRAPSAIPSPDPLPHEHPGMSLRAYFAGQAMAGDFAAGNVIFHDQVHRTASVKLWVDASDALIAALKETKK